VGIIGLIVAVVVAEGSEADVDDDGMADEDEPETAVLGVAWPPDAAASACACAARRAMSSSNDIRRAYDDAMNEPLIIPAKLRLRILTYHRQLRIQIWIDAKVIESSASASASRSTCAGVGDVCHGFVTDSAISCEDCGRDYCVREEAARVWWN
jgi:hypothetical protein